MQTGCAKSSSDLLCTQRCKLSTTKIRPGPRPRPTAKTGFLFATKTLYHRSEAYSAQETTASTRDPPPPLPDHFTKPRRRFDGGGRGSSTARAPCTYPSNNQQRTPRYVFASSLSLHHDKKNAPSIQFNSSHDSLPSPRTAGRIGWVKCRTRTD